MDHKFCCTKRMQLLLMMVRKKHFKSGKSLLAAGIKKVSGKFSKGDHVKILDKNNYECARGLKLFFI